MGTIEMTCAVMSDLLRGSTHDRRSLASSYQVSVAAADRYIRHLAAVPGIVTAKRGRLLLVSFSFGEALKRIGR